VQATRNYSEGLNHSSIININVNRVCQRLYLRLKLVLGGFLWETTILDLALIPYR